MQVPEHVIALYVATCGQNGAGLGSDEKEIILLVYVIIEAATGQIIGTKQILVRPDGSFVKDRTISTSSENSNTTAASPPLALTYPIAETNGNVTAATTITTSSSSSTTATTLAAATINNNNNNNNNNNSNNNSTTTNITNNNNNNNNTNGNIINNTTTATTITNNINNINNTIAQITNGFNGSNPTLDNIINELPIAAIQAAGKPLNEAIAEFDEYLRSLCLNNCEQITIISDGQLPLRQCLHRETCVKDIELPIYYNRFCDLRKEYVKYKTGDLSRALVPVKDIKKILQMPTMPIPQSIAEIMNELNIVSTENDSEFYVKESRDMILVIQTLLKTGHKFIANEVVNLLLEPGICSIDDEIDGNCIVRARGLPWQSSDQDIAKFFRGLNVAKGGVALCLSPLGRRNGEALIRFISQEHRDMALKRHKHHIGNRYIEVYRATGEDFLAVAGGASNEAQAFLSKGAQVIIRMRGLPYDCTAKQVLDFFTTGENPCNVLDANEGVLFVKKPDGRATGDAFVLFANEIDAPKALARHRESIGQRYIELFRSTTAEVQQVLNRSMDPKTYEQNHQPPLIAQLPTMQLSLLPQHLITSGTTKNCIRLRGLPYEALVEHILHFLDDFAKHIIYQGVHMVINAQRQPSGEAFIQMDSEESARLCAQRKHNQFMVFGKKYRYIEVFQCSGDDMNLVLNGGLQSPVPAHSHHAVGKPPALLSPGMLAQPSPSTAQTISPHTHTHAHNLAHVAHSTHSALQSTPTSLASAISALTHTTTHTHVPLSSVQAPPPVAAVATSPYMTASANQTMGVQHPSLTQNALAVSGLNNSQGQLQLSNAGSTGGAGQIPSGAMAIPFFNLPPPSAAAASANAAFIAQQQAQFIAQQNLLARQQAAAVVAEQQQQFYAANFMNPALFMHNHAAAAAAAAAAAGAVPAGTPTAAGQPQLVLMQRPYFQPFPIGYMPSGIQFAPGTTAAGMQAASAAAAASTLPHSMKRSYENAFQADTTAAANAAKRALTRPPSGNTIYQFYNPGV